MSSPSSTSPPASSAVSGDAAPHVLEDCLGIIQLLSDGTVKRATAVPGTSSSPAATPPSPVQWRDVVYDETHDLSLRVYVPLPSTDVVADKKLPVLVYFHGGGFCVGSFALPDVHDACTRLADELPAVVLSADYRLAPEHSLPAALDDACALLAWLRVQASSAATADAWLAEVADLRRVFAAGNSAGANVAHHVAVRVCSGMLLPTGPVRIAGYVLLWPFFGGEQRTASEAAAGVSASQTVALYDQMWRLALPAGASRDHPAANPFGPGSPALDRVELPPVLVASGGRDVLLDRIADYVARLRALGKRVELVEFAGQGHGFSLSEPHGEAADELVRLVRRFVYGGAGAGAPRS